MRCPLPAVGRHTVVRNVHKRAAGYSDRCMGRNSSGEIIVFANRNHENMKRHSFWYQSRGSALKFCSGSLPDVLSPLCCLGYLFVTSDVSFAWGYASLTSSVGAVVQGGDRKRLLWIIDSRLHFENPLHFSEPLNLGRTKHFG